MQRNKEFKVDKKKKQGLVSSLGQQAAFKLDYKNNANSII